MTDVTVALRMIQDRISTATVNSGRESTDIRLVAVSKTHSTAAIRQVLAAGVLEFGENYLQEATQKIQNLRGTAAIWHFIGRIQSNKTQSIAGLFDWVQTVDRVRIAGRLNKHRDSGLRPLNVCIQIRLSPDPTRPGADPDTVAGLAEAIEAMPRLRLRGLMCMPPLENDPAQTAAHFETTRAVYDGLKRDGHELDTLSMGTTNDLEAAIAAGSTLVRVGTAIFGPRQNNQGA